MAIETQETIAVSVAEHIKFGCPHCGFRSGSSPISGNGTTIWQCGECNHTSCVLADGLETATIGIGSRGKATHYPKVQAHPRRGTPSHGCPDKQPEGGGEFFRSRGIGLDWCSCFVCGANCDQSRAVPNIAAFVECKEAGERVVAMFARGAHLGYREREPDRVQVKIGACEGHGSNLEKLHELTKAAGGIITAAHIEEASQV